MIITADITSFVDDYSLNTIGKSQKRLSVNQNGKQKNFSVAYRKPNESQSRQIPLNFKLYKTNGNQNR